MSLYNEMLEAAANALHQHGALSYLIDPSAGQTKNWRDCPRADAHEGAGKQVVDAILDAMDASAKQVRAQAKAEAAYQAWVTKASTAPDLLGALSASMAEMRGEGK